MGWLGPLRTPVQMMRIVSGCPAINCFSDFEAHFCQGDHMNCVFPSTYSPPNSCCAPVSFSASKKLGKSVKKSEYEGECWINCLDQSIYRRFSFSEKIRVGRDYQAVCPDLVPPPERKPESVNDRALLVWSPTKEITDTKCKFRRGLGMVSASWDERWWWDGQLYWEY